MEVINVHGSVVECIYCASAVWKLLAHYVKMLLVYVLD